MALESAIETMASTVSFIANVQPNAREIMLSSGLPVNAENSNTIHLGIVENFSVTVGETAGSATLSVDRVTGAVSDIYLWGQNNVWQHKGATSLTYTATGLVSGQVYSLKIGAVGARKKTVYSDPVSNMVLQEHAVFSI